jgi:hypothetical protein
MGDFVGPTLLGGRLNLCDRRLELQPDFEQAMDQEVLTEECRISIFERRIPPGVLPVCAAQTRVW